MVREIREEMRPRKGGSVVVWSGGIGNASRLTEKLTYNSLPAHNNGSTLILRHR